MCLGIEISTHYTLCLHSRHFKILGNVFYPKKLTQRSTCLSASKFEVLWLVVLFLCVFAKIDISSLFLLCCKFLVGCCCSRCVCVLTTWSFISVSNCVNDLFHGQVAMLWHCIVFVYLNYLTSEQFC